MCDYLTMIALDGLSEGRLHATSPKKQEFSIWLDVLHRLMDIERQAGLRPAQHVVVAREDTAILPTLHPTIRRGVAAVVWAAEAALAGPVVA
jgi:hypothetical protein